MMPPQRGFVGVGTRRVHFRCQGEGPPLVLLHGSPGDAEMLAGEMQALADAGHSCIALDTPGFGFSDALPGETLTVPELAAATAAAMAALGLPRCPVYGTHTGAAIALELGVGFAEQVSGLVLEGLPMFTADEIAALFQDYFAPLELDPLGGHLFATWMRFRDQFTWFPWTSRQAARLNPVDRPAPEDIHLWVSMYYRSAKTYRPAYRAACHYGPHAEAAVRRLGLPAVFLASAEDMLYPHLDRLPPLRADQHVLRLPHDPAGKLRAIARCAASLPVEEGRRFVPPVAAAGREPALQFVATPAGPVLLRHYGSPDKPALLLLHDAPGSGALHTALAQDLARDFQVLLPDLPGHGESAAPPASASALEAAAVAASALAARAGDCSVVGIGVGAAVAARMASQMAAAPPPGLRQLLLIDPPQPDEATAAAIAPALPLSPEGAHWLRAWLCVRDSQIYRPWFDGRVAAQRRDTGCFDAAWLHEQTCALMAGRSSGHRLPQEAWRQDSRPALAAARVPVVVQRGDCSAGFIRSTLHPEKAPA